MPLFDEFSRSSRDLGESDYSSHKSRDDWLNSPKTTGASLVIGTNEMSCLQHRECPAWNIRNVLLGAQGLSCLEHKDCPAWNTRNVLRGTQGMSRVEHRERPAWNTRKVLPGTQGNRYKL